MTAQFTTIDGYIASCPKEVQPLLDEVRSTLHGAIPGGQEAIKYSMPTITLNGRSVVHFAAWKHHISVYPAPATDGDLERRIAPYRSGEATAKFPLDAPIPYDLIAEIATLVLDQSD